MRRIFPALLLLFLCVPANSADIVTDDFVCLEKRIDSLLTKRTSVKGSIKIEKAVRSKGRLHLRFSESISNFPLRPSDIAWLRKSIQEMLPESYSGETVGELTCKGKSLSTLAVSEPGNSGIPNGGIHSEGICLQCVDRGIEARRGLKGRNIALWQSHGYYYNNADSCWMWQRPVIFQIVEDLFTQSFVVPFLTPMLENAGADVYLPRERDWHREELTIDNDPAENESGRIHGKVLLKGKWDRGTSGFADAEPFYADGESPFYMGSFLSRESTRYKSKAARVDWEAEIPSDGEYAVYVTYPALPSACTSVEYVIHSAGADIPVTVNQSIGGGVWEYLGTYSFAKGRQVLVSLSNWSRKKGIVSADAVKIGGGMGNVVRPAPDSTVLATSGKPRFAEGARYFLQWSGYPDKVWNQNKGEDDYRDDLMSRGAWVMHLLGGSPLAPEDKGLGIPVDLSLAFHTDAGTFQNDSIVGTLAIYTLKCNNREKFVNGESRRECRELTDYVQTEVTDDLREIWDGKWTRRQIWNRSYSESRTTGVPAVLLELLSHQNFEDMKYGLDPAFRFTAARAVYKGILKYLAMRYNCPYVVQPLPVRELCVSLGGLSDGGNNSLTLSWKTGEDPYEPTAKASGFIVHTRIDGGGWDAGREINAKWKDGKYCVKLPIAPGHLYSFKVTAFNDGGLSFPSEIVSAGIPESEKPRGRVRVVNDFHRVSGPVWFDSREYAGFDNSVDSGVAYLRDWCFTGGQYEFDRNRPFRDNRSCGFGASGEEYADAVIGGNSFDYPAVHGKALLKAGYAFDSCSASAFASDSTLWTGAAHIDIICGKECEVQTGSRSPRRGGIFSGRLMYALRQSVSQGCNIIISGSYLAHDIFGAVYPGADPRTDSLRSEERDFAREVLGYGLKRAYGSKTGCAFWTGNPSTVISFPTAPCEGSYCVESPDALDIVPHMRGKARVIMNYTDTKYPAALYNDFGSYRTAVFGFPLEVINSEEAFDNILAETLRLLER